jgi:hypothetical protein
LRWWAKVGGVEKSEHFSTLHTNQKGSGPLTSGPYRKIRGDRSTNFWCSGMIVGMEQMMAV